MHLRYFVSAGYRVFTGLMEGLHGDPTQTPPSHKISAIITGMKRLLPVLMVFGVLLGSVGINRVLKQG